MPDVRSNDEVNNQGLYEGILGAAVIGLGVFAGVKTKNSIKRAKVNAKTKFNKSKLGSSINRKKRGGRVASQFDNDFIGPSVDIEGMYESFFNPKKSSKPEYNSVKSWANELNLDESELYNPNKVKASKKRNKKKRTSDRTKQTLDPDTFEGAQPTDRWK